MRIVPFALLAALIAGCGKTGLVRGEPGAADADADTDTDTDSDSDVDADTDTDTGFPPTVWVRRAGGPGEDRATHVATAPDDTSIAVGSFEQTAVFGEGEANETALSSTGEVDLFVAALGPDGALRWAKGAGGPSTDYANGVDAFADGACVVTGKVDGSAVFGAGEPNETSIDWSAGEFAYYAAWYAADGALVAVRSGAPEGDSGAAGWAAAAFPDGSTIVAGNFSGTMILEDGAAGEVELTASLGGHQAFLARYDGAQALVWALATDGDGAFFPYDVAALPDGSFAVAGAYSDTLILGPGEPNETSFTALGGYDIVVAVFDPDGALAWARTPAPGALPNQDDKGFAIARHGAGGVVATGVYSNAIVFGADEPGETTLTGYCGGVFVAAFAAGGDLEWARKAGRGEGRALAAAGEGDGPFYAAALFGGFVDSITFNVDGPDEVTLTTAGGDDVALARYGATGDFAWARAMGGAGDEAVGGLAALPDGSPVLAGAFAQTATFDLGAPAEDTVVSAGGRDAFIARLAP